MKLSDAFTDDPRLEEAGSDAAMVHIAGLCYSGRALTDGLVPGKTARRLWACDDPQGALDALVAAGLWRVRGDGFEIVDYLVDQPSRAHVESVRAARAKAGKSGGQRSGASRRSKVEAIIEPKPNQFASRSLEPRPGPRRAGRAAPVPRCPNNFPYIGDGSCCGEDHEVSA